MKCNEVLSMFPVHKGCVTKYTSKHGPKDMSLSRLPAWFEKLSRGFLFLCWKGTMAIYMGGEEVGT